MRFLIAVSKDLDCKALAVAVVQSSKPFLRIWNIQLWKTEKMVLLVINLVIFLVINLLNLI